MCREVHFPDGSVTTAGALRARCGGVLHLSDGAATDEQVRAAGLDPDRACLCGVDVRDTLSAGGWRWVDDDFVPGDVMVTGRRA